MTRIAFPEHFASFLCFVILRYIFNFAEICIFRKLYKVQAYIAAFSAILLLSCPSLRGQDANSVQGSKQDFLHGWDRWSFRVNALELLCTVPNFSVEFDLSSSPYARSTLSLAVKYNWETWHTLPPRLVFNMLEFRPEYRWWFRIKPRDGKRNWLSNKAFFVGAYAQAGNFAIKPGTYGIQGPLYGIGASFGFDFPLYSYRRLALDFELGVAAGLLVCRSDGFTTSRSGTEYIVVPEKSRSMHLVPYPAFTEIKACFVFRSRSIKDKYVKQDQQKLIEKQEREDAKAAEKERKAAEKERKAAEKAAAKKAKAGEVPENE